MTDLFYDLHIHSCLSPCGGDESTPSAIAGLASVLGLNAVALTDHNSCKNCPAFFEAAHFYGVLPVAGMELTTEEEIHVVCLFPELESALAFDEVVYERLLPIANDPKIYGNQLVMNSDDFVIATVEKCLINATSIPIYDAARLVGAYGGIIIPAHIERPAFSLISLLGSVPEDSGFSCVEIKNPDAVTALRERYPYINQCGILHNSDAHTLEQMSLPVHRISVETVSAKGVIKALSAL